MAVASQSTFKRRECPAEERHRFGSFFVEPLTMIQTEVIAHSCSAAWARSTMGGIIALFGENESELLTLRTSRGIPFVLHSVIRYLGHANVPRFKPTIRTCSKSVCG